MDAVTYPDNKVIDFINENFIPLRIAGNAEPYAADFMVKWTPRIILLNSVGLIHQSNLGFLPPKEFIPSLELGLAKADFDLDNLDGCKKHLDRILEADPKSSSAPEAVFLRGVTAFKLSDQADSLKEAYHLLQDNYPKSEWAQKALPYRLL